jgi:hypothetical protein
VLQRIHAEIRRGHLRLNSLIPMNALQQFPPEDEAMARAIPEILVGTHELAS